MDAEVPGLPETDSVTNDIRHKLGHWKTLLSDVKSKLQSLFASASINEVDPRRIVQLITVSFDFIAGFI